MHQPRERYSKTTISSRIDKRWVLAAALLSVLLIAGIMISRALRDAGSEASLATHGKTESGALRLTDAQWSALTSQPATEKVFRSTVVTEGKIAIDEDHSTPVFSPYAGRVTKLMVKPGDQVAAAQPLFVVEATDTVQAQNDFVTAIAGLNKSQSALELAQIQDRRAQDLFSGKAIPLKDAQTAQANLIAAQSDVRSAEIALEAARNRLRILGLSDEAIATLREKGRIDPATTIPSPISGTVVQRKVGPGQYVTTGSSDPVFVVGDLSSVWLTAFVRETDAAWVALGQDVSFTVLAQRDRTFNAVINYAAAAIDPVTRRLLVRATVDNRDGLFKPEMFANVTIYSDGHRPAVAVPKEALIYEGTRVRVWVAHSDKTVELRDVKTGLVTDGLVEVQDGIAVGESVVTRGALFIDRASSS